MNERDMLGLILDNVIEIKSDVHVLKTEMKEVKEDICVLKSDVAELKSDVATLKSEMKEVKEDIRVLKADVAELKSDVAVLKCEMKEVKGRVTAIENKLENETDKNIRIIAECQLDMRDRFCEMFKLLKKEKDEEMLPMRVSILEKDVAMLKAKIA